MTTKKQQKIDDRNNAIEGLRELLATQPAKNIRGLVTSVSASGMSRRIKFFTIDMNAREYNRETGAYFNAPRIVEITHLVARAVGYSFNDNGARVDGCGSNMIFEAINNACYAVYGESCYDAKVAYSY
ncbi:hypothetical protein UFOVP451_42 [uncultured Caudovirales phage]|uniref:Uncharacterized protein n=1 Tax=uncultured Caudovirales phage TaxID=2100421 RepID=A0A6J5M7P9_9CAUD|nr:hypothetical protein UFOVP451_42 [uncultured Caudovirales phage]